MHGSASQVQDDADVLQVGFLFLFVYKLLHMSEGIKTLQITVTDIIQVRRRLQF